MIGKICIIKSSGDRVARHEKPTGLMFDEPQVDVILVVCRDATHCDRLLPASLPRV